MCALFGIIDYGRSLSSRQRSRILVALAQVCEARGRDATGIAYNNAGKLSLYKRPLAAHRMSFRLPANAAVVMGHTRMATQGDERINANNHPFRGETMDGDFALAHNGVIYNDRDLRVSRCLPTPRIETDSYIAVQLIEQSGWLNFESLASMAEQLCGSFTFTLLDSADNLYFIKGNNPLCIFHWPKQKLYLYASTEALLNEALAMLPPIGEDPDRIEPEMGTILRIDRQGRRTAGLFSTAKLEKAAELYRPLPRFSLYTRSYTDDLKRMAPAFGYTPSEVDELIRDGVTLEEIETYFYGGEF